MVAASFDLPPNHGAGGTVGLTGVDSITGDCSYALARVSSGAGYPVMCFGTSVRAVRAALPPHLVRRNQGGEMNENEEMELRRLEALADLHQRIFDHSQRYTQIIYGMIYAGFFALWFTIKTDPPTVSTLWSGLSMLISISIYGLFAVFSSLMVTKGLVLLNDKLINATDLDRMKLLEEKSNVAAEAKRVQRFNPFVNYISIGTGLLGIGLLINDYIAKIIEAL